MLDIHCHILYGVDDGADNLEESVKMAKLAFQSGVDSIVATPHSNVPNSYQNLWSKELSDKLTQLRQRLVQDEIPLKIYSGNEIFATGNFLDFINQGRLLTINGSAYPLVEFDFYEHSAVVYSKLGQMRAQGLVPIVAHPERYGFVSDQNDAIDRIKAMGCLVQVNKGSIKGSFGREAYFIAHGILSRQKADFVASDAHSPYMRTPDMADIHEIISEAYSEDYANLLLYENPHLVVNNKKI